MKKLKKVGHLLLMVIISLTIGLGFYSWNSKTLLGNKDYLIKNPKLSKKEEK